jgi:hypothetical protein
MTHLIRIKSKLMHWSSTKISQILLIGRNKKFPDSNLLADAIPLAAPQQWAVGGASAGRGSNFSTGASFTKARA